MKKRITRRDFCRNASLAAAGLALGTGCSKRNPIDDTRDIKPPENLQAQGADSEVTLTWSASTDPLIDHYTIYRSDQTGVLAATQDNTFTDTGLTNGTEYTYYITAVDTNGKESSRISISALPTSLSSPLVSVSSAAATSGMTIHYSTVKQMVFSGIQEFTGQTDTGAAFQSLFPGITTTSTIAIKVNTLIGLTTHPEVAFAAVEGLLTMFNGKFPLANITVFDYDKPANASDVLTAAGYANPEQKNPALAGLKLVAEKEADFASGPDMDISGIPQKLSPTVAASDYIINIPVLKDHSDAGITFSLKNHFGSIDKPENLHTNSAKGILYCDPSVVQVFSNSHIKGKQKLIIGDCLFMVAYRGPDSLSLTAAPKTVLIGTDPVAMDYKALAMINDVRSTLISTSEVINKHKPAAYLETAAKAPYSLGNKNSDVTEITV